MKKKVQKISSDDRLPGDSAAEGVLKKISMTVLPRTPVPRRAPQQNPLRKSWSLKVIREAAGLAATVTVKPQADVLI